MKTPLITKKYTRVNIDACVYTDKESVWLESNKNKINLGFQSSNFWWWKVVNLISNILEVEVSHKKVALYAACC